MHGHQSRALRSPLPAPAGGREPDSGGESRDVTNQKGKRTLHVCLSDSGTANFSLAPAQKMWSQLTG